MKFSKETRDVLENFAQLQSSMLFHKGTKQKTNTFSKQLLAEVDLPENIPQDVGIYDLVQFLSVLSIFKDPDVEFEEKNLVLSEGKQKIVYRYCAPELINKNLVPFDKTVNLPSVDVSFELSKETFAKITNATRVLGLSHIAVNGDGEKIFIRSCNPKDENYSFATFEVGDTDKKFNLLINMDHLKVLPHNYKVNMCKNFITKFISQDMDLIYTFAAEKDSVYEG
jgi:hypothetical protein